MFKWFKKLFNSKQSRPDDDWKGLVYRNAQLMVRSNNLRSNFHGYHSKLEEVGGAGLCQIVMTKDGYKAIRPFEKEALCAKDTYDELWEEFLLPHLIKCKQCIDKQMKQSFQDIMYKKFTELNPNLTTNQ